MKEMGPSIKSSSHKEPEAHLGGKPRDFLKKKLIFLSVGTLILLILIIFIVNISGDKSYRTESYKSSHGVAALNATITYDCKEGCKQRTSYNVYILREDGQQVGIVQPDSEGRVRMALPEDTYIMLIGRGAGKDGLFPQERIELKNGQELELKLQFKGADK